MNETFYGFERRCRSCNSAVVDDAVDFFHAKNCALRDELPAETWGWFTWDGQNDPVLAVALTA